MLKNNMIFEAKNSFLEGILDLFEYEPSHDFKVIRII